MMVNKKILHLLATVMTCFIAILLNACVSIYTDGPHGHDMLPVPAVQDLDEDNNLEPYAIVRGNASFSQFFEDWDYFFQSGLGLMLGTSFYDKNQYRWSVSLYSGGAERSDGNSGQIIDPLYGLQVQVRFNRSILFGTCQIVSMLNQSYNLGAAVMF